MPPLSPEDEELVSHLCREVEASASARGIWENHWQDVAKYVFPGYEDSFFSSYLGTPGQKRGFEIYDSTASIAVGRAAAAMESMLTPAGAKYQRWRPMDPVLKRNRAAMLWFEDVTERLLHYRYSPHAAFQSNQHETYLSDLTFGTGAIFTDSYSDPTRPSQWGLRYRSIPIGELFFAVNHQGQTDRVFRRFRMTLRQIAQKWGVEKVPEKHSETLKSKPDTEIEVWHIVKPNTDYIPGRFDWKGRRFASFYLFKAEKEMIRDAGYYCMPYAVSRYMTFPGEIYGRSPIMQVLPAIKTLNEEKRVILQQGQLAVQPVILAHDDGVLDSFSLRSGAINAGTMSGDGKRLVDILPAGNFAIGKELMDDERMAINDACLVTLFQILVETPQMTATEVLERAREKGALLSPTMGRYQAEGLGPMSEREFDLAMRAGKLPPPPQIVIDAGAEYMIEYDAPLNRAMRAEEAAGGMRTFQYAVEMAAQMQDPAILDPFDTDTMVQEMGDINAMPVRWWRSAQAIAQRRGNRQQEQQAAQVAQALPGMAAIMKAAAPEGTAPGGGQPV